MYGYHILTKSDGTHYLLYEFALQGSLESMLKTEEGHKNLTFPRRLKILFGEAQGLNFLHTGKQLDPNKKYTALHQDVIGSDTRNICSKYVKGNRRTGTSANNLRTDVDPLIVPILHPGCWTTYAQ
jgi:hypothetical protein